MSDPLDLKSSTWISKLSRLAPVSSSLMIRGWKTIEGAMHGAGAAYPGFDAARVAAAAAALAA